MDILRRNTDYALRAMVHLAKRYNNGLVSTRELAKKEKISYQLACKLMQKLTKAKLVKSAMGPHGGFRLNKRPSEITLKRIVETIQGRINLNRCLLGGFKCPRKKGCPVRGKLADLQNYIDKFLYDVTLADMLIKSGSRKEKY